MYGSVEGDVSVGLLSVSIQFSFTRSNERVLWTWNNRRTGNNVSLKVEVDPRSPRTFPQLTWLGSEAAVTVLRDRLADSIDSWDPVQSVRTNLVNSHTTRIQTRTSPDFVVDVLRTWEWRGRLTCPGTLAGIDAAAARRPAGGAGRRWRLRFRRRRADVLHLLLEPPRRPGAPSTAKITEVDENDRRSAQMPLNVRATWKIKRSWSVSGNDDGRFCSVGTRRAQVPSKTCDNERCGQSFHTFCLYEWLRSLVGSRKLGNKVFGVCPYCETAISCKPPDAWRLWRRQINHLLLKSNENLDTYRRTILSIDLRAASAHL